MDTKTKFEPIFTEYELTVEPIENIKLEINNLIWMHGPASMTLIEAEEMACKIYELFLEAQEKTQNRD